MRKISEAEALRRFRAALLTAGSMRALAAQAGVSAGLVNDVEKRRRRLTGRLAKFVGVERGEAPYRETK